MKYFIIMLASVFSFSAQAESITTGCAVRTYDCYPQPDGSQKCNWGSDLGTIGDIPLSKTGSAPTYEIYEGGSSGKIRQTYDFRLSIYQRREAQKNFNFLKIEIDVNGITIIANGENTAEARYFDKSKNFGFGLHCSTDIGSAP